MFRLLALITRGNYWKFHSRVMSLILRLYGIRVGRNFYIEGVPRLAIRGNAGNIRFGNSISVFGNIDLRVREQGTIIVEDGVSIDNDCRFVAANRAVLRIGSGSSIGPYCVFNCGADVAIGPDCLIAGFVYIQSSQHRIHRGELIKTQGHTYAPITLGRDVWIGAHATILKGAFLSDGCVVGAHSLVRNGQYPPNTVLVGIPARVLREREE